MPLKKWTKICERIFSQNDYWTYKIDKFEIGDSKEREYHYVHTNGSTMIIPVTSNNRLVLINQFRYLNQMESIEFPCGSVEDGLSLSENAQKELREETGYRAANIEQKGYFAPYTGASDEICSVFIADGLITDPLPSDETEDFEILTFTPGEVDQMIEKNIIWDGLTISAWSLVRKYFK